ncbi:MAG: electron transfer flavoprotein subunit beta/FixA family protein [Syntrophales bacterium]|nr:electron transfer flavoprotein subunit beta/FixA family protein [Syntrophales bacterium]
MSTFIPCFKWIIDEAYIRRNASGGLDFSSVDYKISDYDRNALEEAARLKEKHGGKVIACTVGVPEATKGLKDALSRGADEVCFIADPAFRDLDSAQTAALLAAAIRAKIPDLGLIICGEGSGDLYAQQVGPRLAENLGIPCISFVQAVTVDGDRLTAERRVEDGIEVVSAPLPALVTVLPDINTPRIPGVKDTLMASKKPVTVVPPGELPVLREVQLKTAGIDSARMDRTCERFGTDETEISRFVATLRKSGIIG